MKSPAEIHGEGCRAGAKKEKRRISIRGVISPKSS
jgi:hypothetical protein